MNDRANIKQDRQMNRQPNASAKSKEVQPTAPSQRICTTFAFTPTAPKNRNLK
jgi:hypothetical protein